jgi:hypothetical protein
VTLVALAGQRVLTVTGSAVSATVISDLTFTGGNATTASGGGIRVQNGANPLLVNLVISGNRTSFNGGGIAAVAPSWR